MSLYRHSKNKALIHDTAKAMTAVLLEVLSEQLGEPERIAEHFYQSLLSMLEVLLELHEVSQRSTDLTPSDN